MEHINVLDRKKILDFMTLRKASLDDHILRDFSGGLGHRVAEQREVKYWKEAIERGEFDTGLQEVYIILSQTQSEIVDFTFYTNRDKVSKRVDYLNKLAKRREYWYITMYHNSTDSENDGEMVPKNI